MTVTQRPSASQQAQACTLAHARLDTPVMERNHVKKSTCVPTTMVIALGFARKLVLACGDAAARLVQSLKQVQTLSADRAHLAVGRAACQILDASNVHVEKARMGCKVPLLRRSAANVL